jgi:hypothetical protein
VRNLLALAAALLLGLLTASEWPPPLPSPGLLLAALTVLASPEWCGCLGLGLPGVPPIERRGP